MLRSNRSIYLLILIALLLGGCQPVTILTEAGTLNSEEIRVRDALVEDGLRLKNLFTMTIDLSEPRDIGTSATGLRNLCYYTGGTVHGQRLQGEVLANGEHWFIIRSDRIAELNTGGTLQMADGEVVHFTARGFSRVAPAVMEQANNHEFVDPSDAVFRGVIFFETDDAQYDWLNHVTTIAVYQFTLDQLTIQVYEVA